MPLRNNLSNFQETLADPESRLALQQEYLNNIIESFNTPVSQITGVVLYAEQKTTEEGTNVTAVRIRAEGIHDKYLPDPTQMAKESCSSSNKIINTCLEAHPVVFPLKSQVLGAENVDNYYSAVQGDVVKLELNEQGVLMYGEKIGTKPQYSTMLYDFSSENADKKGATTDSSSSAFAGGIKKQVNDYDINEDGTTNVTWRKSASGEVAPQLKTFLDELCKELGKRGWQLQVTVTSLKRTFKKQAQLMVDNQRNDPKWWPYSSDYNNMKKIANDLSIDRTQAIKDVTAELKKLPIPKSSHLNALALDIRTNNIGMPKVQEKMKTLEEAVKATKMTTYFQIEYYKGKNYVNQKKLRDAGGPNRPNEHMHISVAPASNHDSSGGG